MSIPRTRPTIRYDCPIASCTWHLDAEAPPSPSSAVAVLYQAPGASSGVNESLNGHFATHPWREWVSEIAAERASASAAKSLLADASAARLRVDRFIRELRRTGANDGTGAMLRDLARRLSAAQRGSRP